MKKEKNSNKKTYDDSFEHSFVLENPVVKKIAHFSAYISFIVVLLTQLVFAFYVAPKFPNRFFVDVSNTGNPGGGLKYMDTDSVVALGWLWVAVAAALAIITIVAIKRNKEHLWALGAVILGTFAVLNLSSKLSDSLLNIFDLSRNLYVILYITGFYLLGVGIAYLLFKHWSKKAGTSKRS